MCHGGRNEAHYDCASIDAHKECATVIPPKRTPTRAEESKLWAKTIEQISIAGMENHVLRKHKSGGPIGLAVTGDIADCYLIQWDKKFIHKLKTLGIDLIFYKRFKDDITILVGSMEKGSKFEGGKIIIDDDKKKTDHNRSEDEITLEIIVDIAESVDGIIKFTYDLPKNHSSSKMPVLDVAANINKEENN